MKRTFTKRCYYGIISLLMVLSFSLNTTGQQGYRLQEYSGQDAASIVTGANYVHQGQPGEYPAAVRFQSTAAIGSAQFISWLKQNFEMPVEADFKLLRSEADNLGYVHDRYDQYYKGIPVDGAQYIVQARDGKVTSFRGNAFKVPKINTTPTLTEADALNKALDYFGADRYLWESDFWENELKTERNDPSATYHPTGKLILTKYGINYPDEFRLAYSFDIWALNSEQRIIVDALTGELLYSLPLASLCEPEVSFVSIFNGVRTVETEKYTSDLYRLNDDCQTPNIWVRDWGSTTNVMNAAEIENTTNTWTTQDEIFGATVMWEAKQAYLYFNNVHGRSSYNGSGSDIKAYINAWFGSSAPFSQNNASMAMDGSRMKIGLGSAGVLKNCYAAIDIIAHEFTHAVTGTSAGLQYLNEPGALNEAFSDIFGEMVEKHVLGSNNWLLGADRDDGPARSMIDPKAHGLPDTYLGTNYYTGTDDYGGVHTNCGVMSYWFYLLSEGGTGTNDNGDDYDVTGIGTNKASDIAFRTLVLKLTATSNHAAARTGSIEAAEDLYGDCSFEVQQVTNAWHAVGVGDPFLQVSETVTDITCEGETNGTITLSVKGTSPYSFLWSDGNTGQNRTGLQAGNYSVTVTDANACGISLNFLVTEPNELTSGSTLSDYNGFNVSCNGANDGWAEVFPAEGTPPYSYSWSDGQTTKKAISLAAGDYSVIIYDANGCNTSLNVSLQQPPLLMLSIESLSDHNGYNISCNGGSDGWVTASASGGAPGYSYLWSDGQTTATATGLSAGIYEVTTTDLNGCTISLTNTLTEPDPLTIEAGDNQTVYYGYPPMECAIINWSEEGGGIPPYDISWSDGGEQTHAVCPGMITTTYTVTVTDANGCIITDDVTICVVDVRCGNKLDKVEVCHFAPPAGPGKPITLCIAVEAVSAHLEQGGMIAACGTSHNCPPYTSSPVAEGPGYSSSEFTAYPNPFNNSTTVSFSVESEGNATLRLYDYTGRKILTLFDGPVEVERIYEVEVDGKLLKPGMSYCVLRLADGTIRTLKLLNSH
jgi:Zn-dependent metalloprotease